METERAKRCKLSGESIDGEPRRFRAAAQSIPKRLLLSAVGRRQTAPGSRSLGSLCRQQLLLMVANILTSWPAAELLSGAGAQVERKSISLPARGTKIQSPSEESKSRPKLTVATSPREEEQEEGEEEEERASASSPKSISILLLERPTNCKQTRGGRLSWPRGAADVALACERPLARPPGRNLICSPREPSRAEKRRSASCLSACPADSSTWLAQAEPRERLEACSSVYAEPAAAHSGKARRAS